MEKELDKATLFWLFHMDFTKMWTKPKGNRYFGPVKIRGETEKYLLDGFLRQWESDVKRWVNVAKSGDSHPYVSSAREKEVQYLDLVIIFAEILSKNFDGNC